MELNTTSRRHPSIEKVAPARLAPHRQTRRICAPGTVPRYPWKYGHRESTGDGAALLGYAHRDGIEKAPHGDISPAKLSKRRGNDAIFAV